MDWTPQAGDLHVTTRKGHGVLVESLAGLALLGWLAGQSGFYAGLGVAPNLGDAGDRLDDVADVGRLALQFAHHLDRFGLTRRRHEVVIEGSNDGLDWRAYELPYKPGRLPGAPIPWLIAPGHLPRLDLGKIGTLTFTPNADFHGPAAFDYTVTGLSYAGVAMPPFWFGLIAIQILAVDTCGNFLVARHVEPDVGI
mgnify:CR=1 FL=1